MGYRSIDINLALEQLGGSGKLYKTVVKGFNDRYSDVDRTIGKHLDAGDIEEARRVAHSMKGLCGNLGASKLRERALNLELAIKENRPNVRAYLHGFSEELVKVNEDVKKILMIRYGIIDEGTKEPEDMSTKVEQICDRLLRALETYRYSEIKEAVDNLVKMELAKEQREALKEVFRLIDLFEYDEALALLRKVCMNG